MKAIRRALISVSDKSGLVSFARELRKLGIEILSTGGTLRSLKAAGIQAVPVESVTDFPEVFDGRVKTLHPKIHGGLLFRRDKKSHREQAKRYGIEPIDLVVVNLYPFEDVVNKPSVKLEAAIENIDIGGPSMLRSAAKNFRDVTVICDPVDYGAVAEELKKGRGKISESLHWQLALKVFKRTSDYDRAIAQFLEGRNGKKKADREAPQAEGETGGKAPLPERLDVVYVKSRDLRYGENPHQRAALYQRKLDDPRFAFKQLHGKELSYNNLLDMDAAIDILREFDATAACVIKHTNPCGVAEARDVLEAIEQAIECDSMSAFGGIVGLNVPCTLKAAKRVFDHLRFFEIFVAPSFDAAALRFMKRRKNLRLIATGALGEGGPYDMKFLKTGILLQDRNKSLAAREESLRRKIRFVTKVKLKDSEIGDLLFAAKCVKVVKSNAIVITQGRKTVGIGAGQMSRVDAVDIACRKAGYRTDGGILASDAFFPMPDSIEIASAHKIRAIIQPGGSIRDPEVIAACDRFGLAMALTGERHFRH